MKSSSRVVREREIMAARAFMTMSVLCVVDRSASTAGYGRGAGRSKRSAAGLHQAGSG